MKAKILLVDDDEVLLYNCRKLLESDYAVHTAGGGDQALEIIAADGPFAVVVSDFQMPRMNGLQLLCRIREICPNIVRVMLTSYSQIETALAAVNQGNVFQFLCKPCPESTLRAALEAAIEQHRLIVAEKELLENTLTASIKVLTEILAIVNPAAFSTSQSVTRYVRHVVSDLRLPNAWRFEAAAMLSQLGCVTVYPETVDAIFAGKSVARDEQEKFDRHPIVARRLLERIPRLEYVAALIGLQAEHKSKGHTSGSTSERDLLYFEGEVLRICAEFDRLLRTGISVPAAIATLRVQPANNLRIIESLARLPAAFLPVEALYVQPDRLQINMILDQDIHSTTGLLLVARGAEITEPLLLRLQTYHARGTLQGDIRVCSAELRATT